MINRRKFIGATVFTSFAAIASKKILATQTNEIVAGKPVVISTWDAGIAANKAAWEVLSNKGKAIDAVEKGVMVTEASQNCCVGLRANPDRDGFVTLDACIMITRKTKSMIAIEPAMIRMASGVCFMKNGLHCIAFLFFYKLMLLLNFTCIRHQRIICFRGAIIFSRSVRNESKRCY